MMLYDSNENMLNTKIAMLCSYSLPVIAIS